jgi:hypothetical protein
MRVFEGGIFRTGVNSRGILAQKLETIKHHYTLP